MWKPKRNGYMFYAGGKCTECDTKYIKRSWDEIVLTWDKCATCNKGGVPFIKFYWDQYIEYMENGAKLVQQH